MHNCTSIIAKGSTDYDDYEGSGSSELTTTEGPTPGPRPEGHNRTVCTLQSSTTANIASSSTARSGSMAKPLCTYSMIKIFINSDRVCDRPLSFERVPNKMIDGQNTTVLNTTSKDACLDACLNEVRDSWEAMQVF